MVGYAHCAPRHVLYKAFSPALRRTARASLSFTFNVFPLPFRLTAQTLTKATVRGRLTGTLCAGVARPKQRLRSERQRARAGQ